MSSEGRISARRDRSNLFVSKGPDVCRTPPSMKPVPDHPVKAFMDQVIRDSPDVRNNGCRDVHLDTRTIDIIGHEPGSGKGVVVPGYKKYSHAMVGTDHVYTDGFATVAHRDPAWINHPDPGPTEPRKGMERFDLAANTTTNFKYACKALGIDPIDGSDALHAAKDALRIPANGQCTFDLSTGDIFYGGEHIGNLRD